MILVTGGTGFVGLNVVEQLLARRRGARLRPAATTAGPERDAREPRRIAEVNLISTLNVLEAARPHGVERFVHASTDALFGEAGTGAPEPLDEERHRPVPESMYGITKYAAERSCLRLAALWRLEWCALLARRFPKFRWRESTDGCNVLPLAAKMRTRFSNRRLVDALGWKPRFDLAAAAADFISWLEAHEKQG
jgi:nucleoside-diphosphate-sugar epimerase